MLRGGTEALGPESLNTRGASDPSNAKVDALSPGWLREQLLQPAPWR